MAWKDLQSWIKGGIIGGVFGYPLMILIVILSWKIIPSSFSLGSSSGTISYLLFWQNLTGLQLVWEQMWWGSTPTSLGKLIILISWILVFILIGALIGWIFGKIKNKK